MKATDPIPAAISRSRSPRLPSFVWLLTVACALLSGILFFNAYRSQGDLIEIEFEQGFGLQTMDALRFRGIEIGRVEKIELRDSHPGILVSVRLAPKAREVVTDGTTFWIVRPTVSLEAVRGLETIVGPKYIAMEPGRSETHRSIRFQGLEAPPAITPREGAIEIVLDAKKRYGLDSGAPIHHRGFRIGDVLSVGLASDARSVIVRCAIDPEYHELVRSNSQFWVRSGVRFDLGLSGLKFEADSLGQILVGGVEFATPNTPGPVATTGSRFVLHDAAQEEWLQWQPSLPYGVLWDRMQQQAPTSYRVAVRWKQKSFGFTVQRQRVGWGLLLDDATMICRRDLLAIPAEAVDGSVVMEVSGLTQTSLEPTSTTALSDGVEMARVPLSQRLDPATTLFPSRNVESVRAPNDLTDVLIVGPDSTHGVLVDRNRLDLRSRNDANAGKKPQQTGWSIQEGLQVSKDLDGAPVVSLPSGDWIGFLCFDGDRAWIATKP
ncbi:MAG: MCE family protein [Planctomycetes bacterium]|nr:MCE family protein [Planctomycetota bacterium]